MGKKTGQKKAATSQRFKLPPTTSTMPASAGAQGAAANHIEPVQQYDLDDMVDPEEDMEYPAPAGPAGSLSADYQERVRPVIDMVDRLRRLGLDRDVGLPAIAVVGDQSAGKSSVLEAISGVQLPRGSGIVTRCPLQLRLKSSTNKGTWIGRISFITAEKQDISEDIDSPEDVGPKVREVQDKLAGGNKGISDDLISLEVEAYGLPDLTLIDLPGITRVAVEGQPENIGEQIKRLIKKYINKQETIILAVVPANVDVATSEALQMAKTLDPDGERTLGVVTKPDLIDRGTEEELIAVVTNQRYRLNKGYIVVKCRGQEAIQKGISLEQALQQEQDFFQNATHFHEVPDECKGVRNLSRRLAEDLVDQINKVLPDLKTDVDDKFRRTQAELEKMGHGIPTENGAKSFFLVKLMTSYGDKIEKLRSSSDDSLTPELRLFTLARKFFDDMAKNVYSSVPRIPDPKDTLTDRQYQKFLEKIQKEMEGQRGRELPRFLKFSVCRRLIIGLVDQFVIPSRECMDQVETLLNRVVDTVTRDTFGDYPKLQSRVKSLLADLRSEATRRSKSEIDRMLKMERMVFTQDTTFNKEQEKILEQLAKDDDNKDSNKSVSSVSFLNPKENKGKEAEALFQIISSYMEVSVRRLVDTIPMIMINNLVDEFLDDVRVKVMQLATQNEVLEQLVERHNTAVKRRQLEERQDRLFKASLELAKF